MPIRMIMYCGAVIKKVCSEYTALEQSLVYCVTGALLEICENGLVKVNIQYFDHLLLFDAVSKVRQAWRYDSKVIVLLIFVGLHPQSLL